MQVCAVWLVSVEHEERQRRGRGASNQILSSDPGMTKLCKSVGLMAGRKDLAAFHNDIIGLARLVPGQVFQDSVRTVWSEQERLGWQLIRCTDDAFSVSVTACAVARDTIAGCFENDSVGSSFARGSSFQLLSHASCAMVREASFWEPGCGHVQPRIARRVSHRRLRNA